MDLTREAGRQFGMVVKGGGGGRKFGLLRSDVDDEGSTTLIEQT